MALTQVVVIALTLLQGQLTISQHNVPVHILRRNDMICPHDEDRERARGELSNYIQNYLDSVTVSTLPTNQSCGGSAGWTRITYLNMTDPEQSCPSPWTQFISGNKRVCFRQQHSVASCDSIRYNNFQGEYSQVCGRIIGQQHGVPHGFFPYHSQRYSIDTYYVDGVSVTHGQLPRQHIWTFAAGYSVTDDFGSCPCGSPTHQATIPPYIGNNYFCETGSISFDPLWDGEGCDPDHRCECTLHSPPWFTAQLNTSTTDNIEVRICSYQGYNGGMIIGVELIELYVK